MKRIVFLFYACIYGMLFTSCEKPTMYVSPSYVTLHYEDEMGLTVINNKSTVSWNTDDEFIATVDNNGVVTAKHVGTTSIIALCGHEVAYCSVSVTPKYFTYKEPLIDWGCSKQSIISKKGSPDSNDYDFISYIQNKNNGIIEFYTFENGKLAASYVGLDLNYANVDIAEFLLERYQLVTVTDNGIYGFINAMTLDKANLMVGLTIDNIIIVLYAPWDGNSKNIAARCPGRDFNNQHNELIKSIYRQLINSSKD